MHYCPHGITPSCQIQQHKTGKLFRGRSFGFANGLRRAIEQGRLVLEDFSNLAMALRLLGGALNWPFVPATVNIGSDLQYRRAFEPDVHPNVHCEM